MLFLTVGAQMPFDRLVRAVDAWAAAHPDVDVFAQVGPTSYRPAHLRHVGFMEPRAFRATFAAADAVVSHAGMGNIITALETRKPILVMPRRGDLHETRNDHQLATAQRFRDLGAVEVAFDERELPARLDALLGTHRPAARPPVHVCGGAPGRCPFHWAGCNEATNGTGCPHLLAAVHAFVRDGRGLPVEYLSTSGVLDASMVRSPSAVAQAEGSAS